MSMKDIQKAVDAAVSSQTKEGDNPYWPNLNILARLTEEQGEIGRELNHLSGFKPKKPDEKPTTLGSEIGDAIFTLTCLANSNKIDLDVEVQKAIDKCYGRDKDRFKGGVERVITHINGMALEQAIVLKPGDALTINGTELKIIPKEVA